MKVNADFSKNVVVHTNQLSWVPSPMQGVDRKPLDRVGAELARATSIVRYAPGSHFSSHVHTGGEEFLVLEGVFQDQYGDFPAGTYVRNPPESAHTPRSDKGCVIFVKLWQFEPTDRHQMSVDMQIESHISNQGVQGQQLLYKDAYETVSVVRMAAGETLSLSSHKGAELLLLKGRVNVAELSQQHELQPHAWLRQAVGESLHATALEDSVFWLKQDHLTQVNEQIVRVQQAS